MQATSGHVEADPPPPVPTGEPLALEGTKLRIAEAALQALRERGFAGSSAREIAAMGGFNQALIFYHFGSVQGALLAALDLVGNRRMSCYREAFDRARTVPELVQLARQIQAEDLKNGYVTVLGEMVAGGVSDASLGIEVAARLQPWIDMVEAKLQELVAGTPWESLLPASDIAFATVAFYVGVDMLGQLADDHARAQSLLDLVERFAPLAGALSAEAKRESQ